VQFIAAEDALAQPLAAFTNLTFECLNVTFPVLQVVSSEFWDCMAVSRYNNLRELTLTELYRPDSGKIELAHFWSVGPVFSGIMKLDVVGPSVNIISANSRSNNDVQDSPYV
jgi:hypothetical protein